MLSDNPKPSATYCIERMLFFWGTINLSPLDCDSLRIKNRQIMFATVLRNANNQVRLGVQLRPSQQL